MKQWKSARTELKFPKNCQTVIRCLAAMNHHRPIQVDSKLKLKLEDRFLFVARSAVVMVIQPHFPKRHDCWVSSHFPQLGQVGKFHLRGVIRMHANGTSNVGQLRAQSDDRPIIFQPCSDGDHPTHACGSCACEHRRELIAEPGISEMAMGVDHF